MGKVLIAGVAALSVGCATFTSGNLPHLENFPATAVERPVVDVDLKFEQYLNGGRITLGGGGARDALEDKCVKRARESGLFAAVGSEIQDPDLRVDVLVRDEGEANLAMAFITGLSLYLIPSWGTDIVEVDALVTDTRTGKQTPIHLEETVTMWQHILLIPLMPFKMQPVVMHRAQNNLFDHLALGVHRSLSAEERTD